MSKARKPGAASAAASPAPPPDLAVLLGNQYTAAVKTAIERSVAISMDLGVPAEIAQEAIERALVTVSIGTFQNRVLRLTGRTASVMAACKEMAAMVGAPAGKPSPAERRNKGKG